MVYQDRTKPTNAKQFAASAIETDLSRIKQLSEEHDDENWDFRSWLKQNAPDNIDGIVHGLSQKYFTLIDCKQCANCCRSLHLGFVLVWRLPMNGEFFHGLEYEDSYVYTVAARQIFEHALIGPPSLEHPYSISVCAAGSFASCSNSETFPEHFIGDPYLVSLCSDVIGYRPDIGSIAGVTAACVTAIVIFLICMLISGNVVVAGSAVLVFAITPVFSVYGLETSAEPVSNAYMSLILWFYMCQMSPPTESDSRWGPSATWCAYTMALLFSLTVKRENILLVIVLPVIALLLHLPGKGAKNTSGGKMRWILLSAALAVAFSYQMRIIHTTGGETALLERFPLTLGFLLGLLPMFLRSFLVVQWYGGVAFLVLIGAIVAWRRRGLALSPLLLFVAYILVYAFHIRSYYEMRSGQTDPRAALRFSMNLMGLWSVLAGLGTAAVLGLIQRTRLYKNHQAILNAVGACVLLFAIGASFAATKAFRDDAVEDEFRVRIMPALTAVQIGSTEGSNRNYIATLEPLIIQMCASPNVNVLDLDALDCTVLEDLGFSERKIGVLFLEEQIHQTAADAERYKTQLTCLNNFKGSTLLRNEAFAVVRLIPRSAVQGTGGGH
jgi:hypothetical protein